MSPVIQSTITADGVNVFYRVAGEKHASTILLLHGFPSSSFQFRKLIPLLAEKYRVVAPDLPGFGFTEVPAERKYTYTFDSLAQTVEAFVDALKLGKFAVYIFDYGSPVGFRVALRNPARITALISQNGNAYDVGLGATFWAPFRPYWALPSFQPSSPEALALVSLFGPGPTEWQYTNGVPDALKDRLDPAAWTLDAALLARAGQQDVQLALFYDYGTNLERYPGWQKYLRESPVPVLAMWGANDEIFVKPGAEAFKKDVPPERLTVRFVESGHFALETHVEEYAKAIDGFLEKHLSK